MAIATKITIDTLPGYTQMGVRIGEGTTVAIQSFSHKMSDYWIEGNEAIYRDANGEWKIQNLTSDGYIHGRCTIDATPEVQAAYQAHLAEQVRIARDNAMRRLAEHEANAARHSTRYTVYPIHKGDWVKVVKGRKVSVGTEGKVFWMGESKFGTRIGITTPDSTEPVWVALSNVERVALAPETLRRKVQMREIAKHRDWQRKKDEQRSLAEKGYLREQVVSFDKK